MFTYANNIPKTFINPRKLKLSEKTYGLIFKKRLVAKLYREALSLGLKGMHKDAYVDLTLNG